MLLLAIVGLCAVAAGAPGAPRDCLGDCAPCLQRAELGPVRTQEPHLAESRRRMRRNGDDMNFHNGASMDEVLARFSRLGSTVQRRTFNPRNPITADRESIISYTTFSSFSYFQGKKPTVALPLAVEAVVTGNTIGNGRESFSSGTDNNFFGMDVNHCDPGRNFEERGHVIAARLGGATQPFNIFPQSRTLNRGSGSAWFALEGAIEAFVRAKPATRFVHMWGALSYPTDATGNLVHRPDGVMLRVRAFDGSTQMNVATQTPLKGVNPHENMYFSNDPAAPAG